MNRNLLKKIVVASGNSGKLREFGQMLGPLDIEIVPQSELGIPEAEEPHTTFVENALAKARHASRVSRLPAFADDSGICVTALEGEPGVHSARYAGPGEVVPEREMRREAVNKRERQREVRNDREMRREAVNERQMQREGQDERNNAKLLAALEGLPDRRAHYYCVIVLVRHPDDPEPLIAEGRWHGEVIAEPRGTNGFGYDPYFYLPSMGRTAAELKPEVKNGVSHRGQALRQLVARLKADGA